MTKAKISNMPECIMARPILNVSYDRQHGPWAMDDPFGNAVQYTRTDLVDEKIKAEKAEVLEECAQIAEEWLAKDMQEMMAPDAGFQNMIARQIAKAIRKGGKL